MTLPAYPSTQETASVFFQEALRHSADAVVLFQGGRYPAAIASAHKAQELAVKAALITKNVLGFWEMVFKTHKPLTDISNLPALNPLNGELNRARAGLSLDARDLEQLEPRGFTENTEYPFHTAASPVTWRSPVDEFDVNQAKRLVNIAIEVLTVIHSLYGTLFVPGTGPVPPALS